MRRLFACALAAALVVTTAMGPSLHVHEYTGHDHPEHHHGPASHEHHHSAIPDDDHHGDTENHGLPSLRAHSCDPGQHAVTVTMDCAQAPRLHVGIAERPAPTFLMPTSAALAVTAVTDVRVHGPPVDARIPSRAPPLTHPA